MSVTAKDAVVGGTALVGIIGVAVYNQYQINKLQVQIDKLQEESQTMARYIKLLEAKINNNFKQIIEEPHVREQKSHEHKGHNHKHRVKTPKEYPHSPRPADKEDSEDDDNSPPPSSRRSPPPKRGNPPRRRTVSRPKSPEPVNYHETEEKENSDRVIEVPRVDPNPEASRQNRKKKFAPKDDDESAPLVSSRRREAPKSILRNPRNPETSGNGTISIVDDEDLLNDIESMSKSSKRNQAEGREDSVSSAKMRMERTKAIAMAMQKKREEKQNKPDE